MKSKNFLLFISLVVLMSCSSGLSPQFFNNQVAQLELEAAVDAKRKDCGPKMNPPQEKSPYPKPRLLVYQKKVSARSVRLCSAAILRTDCPLVDYPIICFFIYLPFSPGFALPQFNKMNEDNRFTPDEIF